MFLRARLAILSVWILQEGKKGLVGEDGELLLACIDSKKLVYMCGEDGLGHY